MPTPRLALLNAARKQATASRNFHRELDAELSEFHCPSDEFPEDFAFDGFVVTGSGASVYWDDPWIGQLKTWAGEAIEAGLPALGVCYGHQLLADVLGGEVEDMGEYELGYRTVEHDGENRLLGDLDEEFTVYTSHSDRVAEAPPGATVFARNDYGIHGFRKGDVFGVQFHPEYDLETAESSAEAKTGRMPEERVERALAGVNAENYEAACEAKVCFENFLEYVAATRSTEGTAR